MTPKQALAAHIANYHQALPKGSGRWTMAQLRQWHRTHHHRYGAGLDHTHAGPNLGPSRRPPGWDTGADVVPREPPP
jgi:hypothetical protein